MSTGGESAGCGTGTRCGLGLGALSGERVARMPADVPIAVAAIDTAWDSPRARRDDLFAAVRGQIDGLPPECARFLEALCVLDGRRPPALVARIAELADPAAALAKLVERGIVTVDGGSGDAGPLVEIRSGELRDQVYRGLSPTRRRALHRGAAEALGGGPVWVHLVAAAEHPDEQLAAALECAATGPTGGRGGVRSSTLLEWSSDLSELKEARERRLLLAVLHHVYEGELPRAELWPRVESCAPSLLRSCALASRPLCEGRVGDADAELRRALSVHGAGPGDRSGVEAACARGLLAAAHCRSAAGVEAVEAANLALATAHYDQPLARWLRRLVVVGCGYAHGPRAALAVARDTVDLPVRARHGDAMDAADLLVRGSHRILAGDLRQGVDDLCVLADPPDKPSTPGSRPLLFHEGAHLWLALAGYLLGDWRDARNRARSAIDAARRRPLSPGLVGAYSVASMLSASRGDWTRAEEDLWLARHCDEGAAEPDDRILVALARAVDAHARGDLPAVLSALRPLASAGRRDAPRKYGALWLPLYAEALVEIDPADTAGAALEALRTVAQETPYLQITVHRLRGRLAELRQERRAARDFYEAGLAAIVEESCDVPLHRAQLEHGYGRLLCSLSGTSDGLAWLERARDRFVRLGAAPYARRCDTDVAVSARESAAAGWPFALTERERAVARLVATGLTNQETAARLHVSVKTVEYHLAKIYSKLGIKSRRQLARLSAANLF